jgi:uncharacterized protein YdhG (YjbR/CyaY superfamily)
MAQKFSSVEDYLDSLDPEVRRVLEEVRATLHDAVPEGEDAITYNMPTLMVGERRVVHYAGWKRHVSLYPVPDDEDLAAELEPYVSGQGTLKLPLGKPVPHELIGRVAQRLSAASP